MNNQQNLSTISQGLLPSQQEFAMFQTIAKSAKSSGLYGGDENKIFMVMLAARELGISPLLALNGGIWNIQGKIEISARLMNAMIRRGGHTMEIKSSKDECSIKGKRADTGEEHTEIFTLEMAKRAGLDKSNVWQKYAEDMLYARCMSRLARRLFPDLIGTAYVEGEIREAKEAEKRESNLEMAECEEVSQQIPKKEPEKIDHFPEEKAPVETITEEQAKEMVELLDHCRSEFIENFFNQLESHYGARSCSVIPKDKYDGLLASVKARALV